MYKKILFLFVIALAIGAKAQNITLEPRMDDKQPLWGYVNSSSGGWVVKPAYNLAEPFKIGSDGKLKALVTKGSLKGYIGADGKPLGAGIVFESIEPLMAGENQIVSVKGKKGIISPDASYIHKPEMSDISPLGSEGYIVTIKGKKGLLSPEGRYIIEPFYENIKTSEEDVFIVCKGGKVGILSRNGEMILEPSKYSDLIRFGKYWKIKKGDKVGLFDPAKREVVVSADFAEVWEPFNFSGEPIYPIKNKNGQLGAINSSGKEIISCKNQVLTPIPALNAIRVFRNNVGERLFFINENLFLELKSWNDKNVGPFRLINFEVEMPSKITPDDKISGLGFAEHMIYPRNYQERLAKYNNLGSKKSYNIVMDKRGNLLGKDAQIKTLGNYWVVISNLQPWSTYDGNGSLKLKTKLSGNKFTSSETWITDGSYILFSDLNEYALKDLGDKLKFIKQDNNSSWVPMVNNVPDFNSSTFEDVESFSPNLALVKKSGKWGLFYENLLLPCKYDSFRKIDRNGLVEVRSNPYVGLYDLNAKRWVLSPESKIKSYEFYSSSNNSHILIYNGKWGLANNSGQIIMPMSSTKEAVLKSLTSQPAKTKKNNQPSQKKQQTTKDQKEHKTKNTEFQESKDRRRF